MQRVIFVSLILAFLICGQAFAQCSWKILAVEQDPKTGAIMVRTQYTVPMKSSASAVDFAQKIGAVTDAENNVIKEGTTRYDEESGDETTIKLRISMDINKYCQTLIQRIPVNEDFIQTEILKRNKALTDQTITDLQTEELKTGQVPESEVQWKGIAIKVTDDSKNSVSNITP
ncbi:MAG: hypothetical protein Q7K71_05455 [Candidatus Omnitrophota bacterium]|nr:hypothetical protein [Candidatus Omnitrophota bacterium]